MSDATPEFLRQRSKQLHPKSVFVQARTGQMLPYPTGPYERLNDEQAQRIRHEGYSECVLLAETSTGHILPIVIESGVNNGTDHTRKLGMRRPDGHPAYMFADEWKALPASKRDEMLVKKAAAVSEAAKLEAENAALRAKLAEIEAAKAGARR